MTKKMRQILFNENSQKELTEKGYTKLPLLSEDELTYISNELSQLQPKGIYNPNGGITGVTYHSTTFDTDSIYKQEVVDLLSEVLTPHVNQVFVDYKIVVCNVFAKQPGQGEVEIHQHFPMTANMQERSFVLWCPLTDVDESNGTLQFIEGSHKIVPNITALGTIYYYTDYIDSLKQKYSKALPLKAGECVIFDNNLLHWSDNNHSNTQRSAIQVLCIPKEATLVYFYFDRNKPDRLELLETDNINFFIDNAVVDLVMNRPKNTKSLGFIDNITRRLSEEEFVELLTNGGEIFPMIRFCEKVNEKPSFLNRIKAVFKAI